MSYSVQAHRPGIKMFPLGSNHFGHSGLIFIDKGGDLHASLDRLLDCKSKKLWHILSSSLWCMNQERPTYFSILFAFIKKIFVCVSFVDGHLVVRATHNISQGSEISHCYGESSFLLVMVVYPGFLQQFIYTLKSDIASWS